MKILAAVVGICLYMVVGLSEVYSRESPMEGVEVGVYCEAFAGNAAIGASNRLFGVPRGFVPFSYPAIVEMLEHDLLFKQGGIVVLSENWANPDDRAFLELSGFYGYDYVQRMQEKGAVAELPRSMDEAVEMFFGVCMAQEGV